MVLNLRRKLRRAKLVGPLAVAVPVALCAAWGLAQQRDRPEPTEDLSKFVYAERVETIRFSHAKHSSTACTDCHGAATTSRRAADDLTPAMTQCVGCHAERQEPLLAECAACHIGHGAGSSKPIRVPEDWRSVRPAPMKIPAPRGAVRFSHAAHATEAKCETCHGDGAASEPTLPPESTCLGCHDGARSSAPTACTTCHPTSSRTGRLATSRPGVIAKLRPDNHSVDWLERHATVARGDAEDCMTCHTEPDCASCHSEKVATPFAAHPPGYLTIHMADARLSAGNCTDCHSVETFCTTCHVRADVTTRLGSQPPPRRSFHPPGWLDGSFANSHGFAARRDIVECASCHTETDCITCHAGVNPHPPEFAFECGSMLASNPAACSKCHSDPTVLRSLCR